ncbi:putative serine hydrolase isoform X1 [Andrena cerasifolii]|uniref:putative serine hydrolase isoform X1 n=1 Tax=Andrena cerasifolii TaxID=2819439 RepID=UPI0040382422
MSAVDQSTAPTDRMTKDAPEEIKIPVPWGHLSGKWWGPKNVEPIVALHGRQDNAGSFDTLIPLLPDDISVLCLDMSGHGLSSHYPKSQYYYAFWDGVILLRRIVKHFKWSKMKLLGHSLGGAVAFLYAATYPDDTEFVIALDMAGPTVGSVAKRVPATGTCIDKFLEYDTLNPENVPTYTYEDIIQIASNGYNGAVCKEGIVTLMKRGALPSYQPDQYYFARDPRLKVAYLGMLSMDLILAYAAQIKCAYLNIRATKGYVSDEPESYQTTLDVIKKNARRFEYHEVEGNHFVHLNNPERVAPIIIKFLRT